jgi:hypothetical protein
MRSMVEGHGPQSAAPLDRCKPRVPLHQPSAGPPPRPGEDLYG